MPNPECPDWRLIAPPIPDKNDPDYIAYSNTAEKHSEECDLCKKHDVNIMKSIRDILNSWLCGKSKPGDANPLPLMPMGDVDNK